MKEKITKWLSTIGGVTIILIMWAIFVKTIMYVWNLGIERLGAVLIIVIFALPLMFVIFIWITILIIAGIYVVRE